MEGNTEVSPRKSHVCHICDRTFIRYHRLQSHIRTHKKRKVDKNLISLTEDSPSQNSEKKKITFKCDTLSTTEKPKLLPNAEDHSAKQPQTDETSSKESLNTSNNLTTVAVVVVHNNYQPQEVPVENLLVKEHINGFQASSATSEHINRFQAYSATSEHINGIETSRLIIDDMRIQDKHTRPSTETKKPKSLNKTVKKELDSSSAASYTKVTSNVSPNYTYLVQEPGKYLVPQAVVSEVEVGSVDITVVKPEPADEDLQSSRKKVSYQCDECQRMFTNKCHFERHLRIHSKEKPHVCKVCSRGFAQVGNLNSHIRVHALAKVLEKSKNTSRPYSVAIRKGPRLQLTTERRPHYFCSVCGKEFHNKCYLDRHFRTHTNEKPHVCTVCFKGFTQVGNLNVHYLTHTKQKNFVCHVCDKGFTLLGSLKAHLLTHLEQKPYKCEVCGKGFANKCFLKRHSLTHSEDKPHVCNVCHKGFVQVGNLNVHLLIHSKPKEFKCDLCDQIFNKKIYLNKHYKDHANVTDDNSKPTNSVA